MNGAADAEALRLHLPLSQDRDLDIHLAGHGEAGQVAAFCPIMSRCNLLSYRHP